jgi:hypothetical protein
MYPNSDCKSCADCTPTVTVVTPVNCAGGNQCVDLTGTDCVVYQGTAYTCGAIAISPGDTLTSILNKILAAICAGGFTGPQGEVGPTGATPTLTVTPTVTLATDILPPLVTMTETSPDVYNLEFRLPKGEDGVTPNLFVQSTSTGSPGTNASVSINPASTYTNVLLDFVIPKGDQGPAGPPGPSTDSYISNVSLSENNLVFTGTNMAFNGSVNLSSLLTPESYIDNVVLSGTNLNFTGVNSAFSGTIDLSSFIDIYDVTSGLTAVDSNTFRLGGTLTQSTTITTDSTNVLRIGGDSAGGTSAARLEVFNTSTTGGGPALRVLSVDTIALEVYSPSSSYSGVFINTPESYALNTSGKYANVFTITDAIDNNTKRVLSLEARITNNNTPYNGIGGYIEMVAPRLNNTSDVELHVTSRLQSYWENVLNSSYNSVFRIDGANHALGSIVEVASFKGTGEVVFHKYGVGTFAGSAVYTLGVDATGNIVEYNIGSGTINHLARWTPDGQHLGDSLIIDDSNHVTLSHSYQSSQYDGLFNISNITTNPSTYSHVIGMNVLTEISAASSFTARVSGISVVALNPFGGHFTAGLEISVNAPIFISGGNNVFGIKSYVHSAPLGTETVYGHYNHIGPITTTQKVVGSHIRIEPVTGGGVRYGLQIEDGSQGLGKALLCVGSNGEGLWGQVDSNYTVGFDGTFTTVDGKTVTVTNGLITLITP